MCGDHMFVKDLMSRKINYLKPTDSVSKFISFVQKNHTSSALVIDNKKLVGAINIKLLSSKGITDPSKTKIKKVLKSMPPTLHPNDDIIHASKLLFESGLKELPVIDNSKVIGMLSIENIIDEFSKTKLFRQTKTESLMSPVITITQKDDIGKARQIMREKNISKLPVIDQKGKLIGVVTTFDILKTLKPRERMDFYSMAAEMERIMKIPITTIMDKKVFIASPKDSLNSIFNIMKNNKRGSVIITENKKPIGIIIMKDLLEYYLGSIETSGMIYQIIGLKNETNYIVSIVERMVNDALKRLSSIYKPLFLFIHVKKRETGLKSRIKYSIRIRFGTEKGTFVTKSWDWDLLVAIKDALDKLEKIVFKDKRKIKDHIRFNLIRIKEKFRKGR